MPLDDNHPMRRKRRTYRPTHIRQWREYRGLSLDRLSDRLGIDPETGSALITKQSLSRIERGLQPYSQPLLEAIAHALQCTPADLIMRDPTDPSAPWTIWETIQGLPPEAQEQAANILDAFARGTKKTAS